MYYGMKKYRKLPTMLCTTVYNIATFLTSRSGEHTHQKEGIDSEDGIAGALRGVQLLESALDGGGYGFVRSRNRLPTYQPRRYIHTVHTSGKVGKFSTI